MAPSVSLAAWRYALVTIVGSLLVAGCGGDGLKLVPVQGRVTFDGGDWPAPGTLYFAPEETFDDLPRLPGRAEFSVDGRFVVTTKVAGDGLVPGRYVVNIACWKPAGGDNPEIQESHVPPKYQSGARSGLRVEVPRDAKGVVEVSFDVPQEMQNDE